MAKIRSTVSFDEQIIDVIDAQSEIWVSDRSNTIKRIVLEWKQMRDRLTDTAAPYIVGQPTTEASR